jgi:hypothetical protein
MGINAFQTSAFQQATGTCAFQELTTVITGGRYITEKEVQVDQNPWKYKAGLDTLYRHIAAVNLGQKGGMAYANALQKKSR